MSRIPFSKVVAGGILAGIVVFAFDFVTSNYLLAEDWLLVAQRHNVDTAVMGGTGALVLMAAIDLVLGLTVVLTYSGIRAGFGPGAGTGAIASFIVFVPAASILATFGGWLIPWDLFVRQSIVLFVALLTAGFAGLWICTEDEALR
jgi:hypothetical protein